MKTATTKQDIRLLVSYLFIIKSKHQGFIHVSFHFCMKLNYSNGNVATLQ